MAYENSNVRRKWQRGKSRSGPVCLYAKKGVAAVESVSRLQRNVYDFVQAFVGWLWKISA